MPTGCITRKANHQSEDGQTRLKQQTHWSDEHRQSTTFFRSNCTLILPLERCQNNLLHPYLPLSSLRLRLECPVPIKHLFPVKLFSSNLQQEHRIEVNRLLHWRCTSKNRLGITLQSLLYTLRVVAILKFALSCFPLNSLNPFAEHLLSQFFGHKTRERCAGCSASA